MMKEGKAYIDTRTNESFIYEGSQCIENPEDGCFSMVASLTYPDGAVEVPLGKARHFFMTGVFVAAD